MTPLSTTDKNTQLVSRHEKQLFHPLSAWVTLIPPGALAIWFPPGIIAQWWYHPAGGYLKPLGGDRLSELGLENAADEKDLGLEQNQSVRDTGLANDTMPRVSKVDTVADFVTVQSHIGLILISYRHGEQRTADQFHMHYSTLMLIMYILLAIDID
ncbi:hypothetical protein DL98DRAFT_589782 [Cadophora sp. DSE1049]|nr:hypothetical protein DL98DRAFT_589782 [Cadophora sp. DSE1049]